MNTKILLITGAVVIAATGVLVLDSLDRNRGYVDPMDEPDTLTSDFTYTPTGGGEFTVGEPIVAGFTMTYSGTAEGKDEANSRFFVDEMTVFATSNNDATSPNGKAIVPVNGTALMNGEIMTYDLPGYTCAKPGDVSIIFKNILTRYDLAGVPQVSEMNGHDKFWGGDVYVSVKCVEQAMQQIDVQNPSFQAGSAPLGWNEAETGYLHDDGNYYYNGQVVDREGVGEGSILDDLR